MDLLIPSDWPQIIGDDHAVYWTLAVAVPKFGRSTLTTQAYWRGRFTKVTIEDGADGTKTTTWRLAGRVHRDGDVPARTSHILITSLQKIIPVQSWYKFGKLHRDGDKPAIIYENYMQEWCQDGRRHRDNDLPAVVFADGRKMWFQHGKEYRDNDLPTRTDPCEKSWYLDGKLHRDRDRPCLIGIYGLQMWRIHGLLHRDGGKPAIIHGNGQAEWWENGSFIRSGCVDPAATL